MNKPGMKLERMDYERRAAQVVRDAHQHHLDTALAAFADGEEAMWSLQAADMFFGRCMHPIFMTDAIRKARRWRLGWQRAAGK